MEKSLHQQACRCEQDERQSDFAGDQRMSPESTRPAGAAGAAGVREMLRGAGARCLARGREAEQNGGEQAQSEREDKRLGAYADLVGERQAGRGRHQARASGADSKLANRIPPMAPMPESTRFSARSCRTIWPREAPIAMRTENSYPRAEYRASSRFATLAQAIRSMMPTAHWSRKNGLRIFARDILANRRSPRSQAASPLRESRARPALVIAAISARAWATETPSRNRPMITIDRVTRSMRCALERGRQEQIGLSGDAVVRHAIRRGQNSHDPHTAAIELHRRTDQGFGAAECRTPERIADQRHVVLALQSLVRKKGAAAKSLNARDIEEVRSHFVGKEGDQAGRGRVRVRSVLAKAAMLSKLRLRSRQSKKRAGAVRARL